MPTKMGPYWDDGLVAFLDPGEQPLDGFPIFRAKGGRNDVPDGIYMAVLTTHRICIVEGKDKTVYKNLKRGDNRHIDGADPCEPSCVRSPDGKQLLLLMRENRRRMNSLYITSNDEAGPPLHGDNARQAVRRGRG